MANKKKKTTDKKPATGKKTTEKKATEKKAVEKAEPIKAELTLPAEEHDHEDNDFDHYVHNELVEKLNFAADLILFDFEGDHQVELFFALLGMMVGTAQSFRMPLDDLQEIVADCYEDFLSNDDDCDHEHDEDCPLHPNNQTKPNKDDVN